MKITLDTNRLVCVNGHMEAAMILSGESSFGMDLWEMEESVRISDWQKWVRQAEKLAGHSLDGDQEEDGYSLDFAHDAFEAGHSPKQYVSSISKR